jgi:hypothetical protein
VFDWKQTPSSILSKRSAAFFGVGFVVINVEEGKRAEVTPVFSVLRYTAPVNSNCGATIPKELKFKTGVDTDY